MKRRSRDEHLFDPGPKRILALDGGGVRGVLTLAYLQHIEDILRERHGGDPAFRLADYFDLIGGTSTGAIIAGALALGFPVDRLREMYRSLGVSVFRRSPWSIGLFGAKFPSAALQSRLDEEFGDVTLGGAELRTGLAIVAKRMDSGSPWILHNNPRGRYFDPPTDDPDAVPNRDIRLSTIVRASAAAPHYFEPERLRIAEGMDGAFVDGGVTPFNNPSLMLLMVASFPVHGFCWPLGADRLSITSLGTGARTVTFPVKEALGMSPPAAIVNSMRSLIGDCDMLGQTLLQWLSDSPAPWFIDSEIGTLDGVRFGGQAWLSYIRYNTVIEPRWLKDHLGIDIDERQAMDLFRLDEPRNISHLSAMGDVAARIQVQPEHFPAAFDPGGG